MTGRYILTDKVTGEIIDTAPIRRSYRSRPPMTRRKSVRRVKGHHETFVALALALIAVIVTI